MIDFRQNQGAEVRKKTSAYLLALANCYSNHLGNIRAITFVLCTSISKVVKNSYVNNEPQVTTKSFLGRLFKTELSKIVETDM